MIELTSTQGSIELAISALLLVLGYRLARPARGRDWLAMLAYAVALAGQLLGRVGVLRGHVHAPGLAPRVLGAAILVTGLVLAGAPARARRRMARSTSPDPPLQTSGAPAVPAGLALVLAGQLLRGPSTLGIVAVAGGIVVNAAVALQARLGSRA